MGRSKTLRAAPPCARQRGPLEPERIIADALVDVATELRLTDAAELILMIRNDHAANIADLVNSSTELFYKSGTAPLRPLRKLQGAVGRNARRRHRHGVSSRHGVGLLSTDDRSEPCRRRDHRHSVRRAGPGRPGESRTPPDRLQERAGSRQLAKISCAGPSSAEVERPRPRVASGAERAYGSATRIHRQPPQAPCKAQR